MWGNFARCSMTSQQHPHLSACQWRRGPDAKQALLTVRTSIHRGVGHIRARIHNCSVVHAQLHTMGHCWQAFLEGWNSLVGAARESWGEKIVEQRCMEEGGRHQAKDTGDPIWCAEDCVYAVWECVRLCTSAHYNDGVITSSSVELLAVHG